MSIVLILQVILPGRQCRYKALSARRCRDGAARAQTHATNPCNRCADADADAGAVAAGLA
ncbi:hypothetical protein FZ025_03600 [Xanthomonas hyacinthi]|uniref:Uncharacterized protein n=1 Tax=Xanthomonas hyacinthi TaxID=56455 RepID=A0A2S7F2H7_9XANT|nr:hypothetical protein [Xanthomonas hyacinthi]KLD80224.1 hypothetical protein Y886_00120 [Xanthomonas hyacinthi DSM 19077]PPU99652.1 hypothetical protein XhyaCFBP1156_00270 [Xanthomonas hyacinthi]QGY75791.1 hypothetical protein FZ025_03600 [Xanthomonas hyacinthi]